MGSVEGRIDGVLDGVDVGIVVGIEVGSESLLRLCPPCISCPDFLRRSSGSSHALE